MTTYICQEKRKTFQNFAKKYLSSFSKYHSVVFIYEIISGNNYPTYFNNKANNNINKNNVISSGLQIFVEITVFDLLFLSNVHIILKIIKMFFNKFLSN